MFRLRSFRESFADFKKGFLSQILTNRRIPNSAPDISKDFRSELLGNSLQPIHLDFSDIHLDDDSSSAERFPKKGKASMISS